MATPTRRRRTRRRTPGTASLLTIVPDQQLTVVVLTNADEGARLARLLLDPLLSDLAQVPPTPALSVPDAQTRTVDPTAYAGQYANRQTCVDIDADIDGRLWQTTRLQNDELVMAHRAGFEATSDRHELRPIGSDTFVRVAAPEARRNDRLLRPRCRWPLHHRRRRPRRIATRLSHHQPAPPQSPSSESGATSHDGGSGNGGRPGEHPSAGRGRPDRRQPGRHGSGGPSPTGGPDLPRGRVLVRPIDRLHPSFPREIDRALVRFSRKSFGTATKLDRRPSTRGDEACRRYVLVLSRWIAPIPASSAHFGRPARRRGRLCFRGDRGGQA